jgi:choline dehydrogenase-like flavoprotein
MPGEADIRKEGAVKKAIVVGSGAGGAAAARSLHGKFDVTILEAGKPFRPLKVRLPRIERIKKAGLLFDETLIQPIFPAMRIGKGIDGMIMVSGRATGGTTTICAGNALRMDSDLKAMGIDLDREFDEIYDEIPITSDHRNLWRPTTRRLFEICEEMGLGPVPTPKMGDYSRCKSCGRCILGCPNGIKWDSRRYLSQAVEAGAKLISGNRVERIVIENDAATGVISRRGLRRKFYEADLVVLAAGGFGTPVILGNSGIECERRLFVDPVLTVAAEWKGCNQYREIPMPFVVQCDRYIISPYFDLLSFFFNKDWKYPASDTLGIMIKLADEAVGGIGNHRIEKILTAVDKERLEEAVEICREVLFRLGVRPDKIFLGTVNAGHPGGMMPLTGSEAATLHNSRLPENVYVADATLLPQSLGNPPILTIIALAKKIASLCRNNV